MSQYHILSSSSYQNLSFPSFGPLAENKSSCGLINESNQNILSSGYKTAYHFIFKNVCGCVYNYSNDCFVFLVLETPNDFTLCIFYTSYTSHALQ